MYETDHWIGCFCFNIQLLRKVGVVELLFTSDNQKFVDQSLTMRPAEEVLLTLNFMNDHGGLDRLKVIQVRHHCPHTWSLNIKFTLSLFP